MKDTYIYMKELIEVIENSSIEVSTEWFDLCKLHCEDLKTWKPEVYISTKEGVIVNIVANTSMHINILDLDDEAKEKLVNWLCIISEGIEKGFLKNVME